MKRIEQENEQSLNKTCLTFQRFFLAERLQTREPADIYAWHIRLCIKFCNLASHLKPANNTNCQNVHYIKTSKFATYLDTIFFKNLRISKFSQPKMCLEAKPLSVSPGLVGAIMLEFWEAAFRMPHLVLFQKYFFDISLLSTEPLWLA